MNNGNVLVALRLFMVEFGKLQVVGILGVIYLLLGFIRVGFENASIRI